MKTFLTLIIFISIILSCSISNETTNVVTATNIDKEEHDSTIENTSKNEKMYENLDSIAEIYNSIICQTINTEYYKHFYYLRDNVKDVFITHGEFINEKLHFNKNGFIKTRRIYTGIGSYHMKIDGEIVLVNFSPARMDTATAYYQYRYTYTDNNSIDKKYYMKVYPDEYLDFDEYLTHEYFYTNNYISGYKVYSQTGLDSISENYVYDENNFRHLSILDSGIYSKNSYSFDSLKIESRLYNENDEYKEYKALYFNSDWNLSLNYRNVFSSDSTGIKYTTTQEFEDGFLIDSYTSIVTYNKSFGTSYLGESYDLSYEFEYDTNGNWIKQTKYIDGVYSSEIIREISYYQD